MKGNLDFKNGKGNVRDKTGFYFILSQCFSVGFFPHIQPPKKKIFIK